MQWTWLDARVNSCNGPAKASRIPASCWPRAVVCSRHLASASALAKAVLVLCDCRGGEEGRKAK